MNQSLAKHSDNQAGTGVLGNLFRQIRDLLQYEFNNYVASVCSRSCNQVAHCLAACGACMEEF
jgi:hypothetical protein